MKTNKFVVLPKKVVLIVGVALVFGVVGIILLASIHAATPTTDFEAENGTLTNGVLAINDANASAGKAVQFSSANSSCPPTNPDITPDYTLPTVTNGLAPILSKISTQKKVVFLTIDNGNGPTEDTPTGLPCGIQATMFVGTHYTQGKSPDWFTGLLAQGSVAESFTADHATLTTMSYDDQKADILLDQSQLDTYLGGNSDYKPQPKLFRAPGGSSNSDTQKAAYDAGMLAIVKWDVVVNQDSSITYGSGNTAMQKGDIVLVHFYSTGGIGTSVFPSNISAFLAAAKSAGLTPVLLENWLE